MPPVPPARVAPRESDRLTPTPKPTARTAGRGAGGWQRTLAVAVGSQVVVLIGLSSAIPFLPLYVQHLGVQDRAALTLWSGVLAAASPIPQAVLAPFWGVLADRHGRKLMLVRSIGLGGLVLLVMGFAANEWQLLVLRVIQGAVGGGPLGTTLALVSAAMPAQHLGMGIGLVNMAFSLGISLGPGLGGLTVGAIGFRGSFILAGALAMAAGASVALWLHEPPRAAPPVRAVGANDGWFRQTLRVFGLPRFRTVLLITWATTFVGSATGAMLAIYLQDLPRPSGMTPEIAAGLALAANAGATALATPLSGRLADTHGPRAVLLASLAGLAATFVPQAFAPDAVAFLIIRAGSGVFMAGAITAASVLIKTYAPHGQEGAAYGAASAAQSLGWGLGPLLGAALAAVTGIPSLFVATAVVALLMAIPASRLHPSRG